MDVGKAAALAVDLATMEHPMLDRFVEWFLSPPRRAKRRARRVNRQLRRLARRSKR